MPPRDLRRRARPWTAALIAILGAALLGACGRESRPPGPEPRRGPNVLLVTLDTTRADRLGCYGFEDGRTPAIDALAAEGLRVERAYAPAPLTLPSHATILSGVEPAGHGLHVNFQGALPEDLPTLAQRFHAAGYRTGAFVGAWVLNAGFGLERGFERYDDLAHLTRGDDARVERPANQVVDAALRWLETPDPRPFFAWVHFFDPHEPYEPPSFYADGLGSLYDGELAFVDAQLARLLGALDARGVLDELVVVLTADHGESLGDHGEATHGVFVYDATMRVPLILRAPGRVAPGAVLPGPVGLVDLAPTLLELLGLPPVASHAGASFLSEGAGAARAARPVLLESEYPRRAFGWARLFALVSGDEKVIRAPTPELYDLARDPGELTDLARQEPARAAELLEALERRLESVQRRQAPEATAALRGEGQLAALGYVAGAAGPLADDDLALRNPKDALHVLAALRRARRSAAAEAWERVVSTLEPLAEEAPETDELFALLGRAQLELGRFEDAEPSLRKGLRVRPDHAARLTQLGDALRGQGRADEALSLWARALQVDPSFAEAHARLGLAHAQAARFELALHHFRRRAELEPSSPDAEVSLANVLLSTGRTEEGLERLRRALELDARSEPAHRSLWRALSLLGRPLEAIGALREARTLFPADRSLACELAWLLATTEGRDGPRREALVLAEACVAGEEPLSIASLDLLAAAAADAGDYERAVAEAERALEQVRERGLPHMAEELAARLALYRAGRAYREASGR